MPVNLLPPLTKDLNRYVDELQQTITEHDLHASSIIRLKDAFYGEEAVDNPSISLRKLPDYESFFSSVASNPNNSPFTKYWAVETNLGTLLFSHHTGLAGLYQLQRNMEQHYFDADFPLRHVRHYEVCTLNRNPVTGTDAYLQRALSGNLTENRFVLPDDVFCDPAILQDGVCVADNNMAPIWIGYSQFMEDNLLVCSDRSFQIALLLKISESGWDSLDVEQRCDCRFAEHFRAVRFGAEHSDFQTDEEKAKLLRCDRLYASDLLKQFYPDIRKEGHLQVPPLNSKNGQNLLKP